MTILMDGVLEKRNMHRIKHILNSFVNLNTIQTGIQNNFD